MDAAMIRAMVRSWQWLRTIALACFFLGAAAVGATSGPVNPPFLPTFGTGAPGGNTPTNQLYFDTSASPFQGYVYDRVNATWETFGGGGGGGGCSGAAGSILISSTGTNCVGDSVLSDGAGNWSNLITLTWIANRLDDPGDIIFSSTANIRANGLNIGGGTGSVDIGTDGGTGHDVNLTGWDIAITGGNSTTIGTTGQPLNVNGTPTISDPTDWTAALQACTASLKGMVPTPPNDASKFLDGTCHFSTPGGGSGPDLFAPPTAATFTAFTGDAVTPTFADQSYGMVASIGASSAGNVIRGGMQALPATPWVMVGRFRQTVTPFSFRSCGPAISDGTQYTTLTWGTFGSGNNLFINTWSTATTNAGTAIQVPAVPVDEYYSITDDGTTRKWSVSADGRNFAIMFQETHTNFLTPTEIGFACQPFSSAGPTAGTDNLFEDLLYWSVT